MHQQVCAIGPLASALCVALLVAGCPAPRARAVGLPRVLVYVSVAGPAPAPLPEVILVAGDRVAWEHRSRDDALVCTPGGLRTRAALPRLRAHRLFHYETGEIGFLDEEGRLLPLGRMREGGRILEVWASTVRGLRHGGESEAAWVYQLALRAPEAFHGPLVDAPIQDPWLVVPCSPSDPGVRSVLEDLREIQRAGEGGPPRESE